MMEIHIFFDGIQYKIYKYKDYVIWKFQNVRCIFDSKSNRAYQEYKDKGLKLRIFKFQKQQHIKKSF